MKFWIKMLFLLPLFFTALNASTNQDIPKNSTLLQIKEEVVDINGRKATIFAITQKDGTYGLTATKGESFNVKLENTLKVPTSVHWHGLVLPNNQDGVAFVTQFPIYPGLSYDYNFPILQAGTFWMHSHVGLQEQRLLTAPLIFDDPNEKGIADQEAIILLSDFSFKPSEEIYRELKCPKKKMQQTSMSHSQHDIVEVEYDAFLANHRTLESPEIVYVKPGEKIRLRIINGSSATNFFILLGNLLGEAIAVDGNKIIPFQDSKFELAVAQRIDILVKIPKEGGMFPILAQGEGTDKQTGVVLITEDMKPILFNSKAVAKIGPLTNEQEAKLKAISPLPIKNVDKRIVVELGGDMEKYVWTLNNQSWPEVTPVVVEKGQRVEIVFKNNSTMSHPMHLHGHVFQVTSMNEKNIEGAMRDTVLVTPQSSVAIQFDADNPGVWPLHCHVLYHLEAGMMTVLRYKNFIQPL